MSIILNALKNTEQDTKGEGRETKDEGREPLPNGEGFFRGKQSFIKKSPAQVNKRVYILAGVFLILLVVSFGAKWLRGRQGSESFQPVVPAPQSAAPAPTAVTEQSAPVTAQTTDYVQQAKDALSLGNYEESIKLLKLAIVGDPDNSALHNDLGMVFMKKELYSNAEAEYNKALELDTDCAECLNNLGYLKSVLDQSVEAKKYLEKACAVSDSYPDPYFNLAVLYENEGDIGNAVKNYRQFVSFFPDKSDPMVVRVNNRIMELAGR